MHILTERKLLLVGAFLGCLCTQGSGIEARVHRIAAGQNGISSAVSSAASDDTLMLTTGGGIYHETDRVMLPAIPLTIMAAPDLAAPPVWTTDGTRHLKVYHNLAVQGIRFDGQNRTMYAIRSYASRPNRLVIENCEIAHFTEDGVTDNDVPVDTCIVRNTIFHDIRKVAIEFRTEDMCRNLIVENCTFYRLGEHAIHIAQKAVPLKVSVSNITVHNSSGGICLNNISDAAVTSSSITGCRIYAVRSVGPAILTDICTFQNVRNYDLCAGGEGCFNADPRYFSPEAGDFSLLPDSPCLTSGLGGGPLGKTNREVADLLNLSEKTVATHRTNLMRKLNLHNMSELVRHAIRVGLIEINKEDSP